MRLSFCWFLLAWSATAFGEVTLSADFHAEYLSGQPVRVRIELANSSDVPVQVPDLNARPHLVRFDLVPEGGRLQTRFITPPGQEGDSTWTLGPRGRRQVLMDLPSGRALRAGSYRLAVRIEDGDQAWSFGPRDLLIAEARPVAGRLGWEPHGGRGGIQTLWVHRAARGFDVYLHQASEQDPGRVRANHHLLHTDEIVDPILAFSPPQVQPERVLYWQSSPRTISYAKLRGTVLEGVVESFQSPHPAVDLVGRGTTDADGGLHVPIWIPAPSGAAGELRVVSLKTRKEIRFRLVVRLESRPDHVETTLDAAGQLRILVAHGMDVDLYVVPPQLQAPAVGTRLNTKREGKVVLGRFGVLPKSETHPGGRAVLVMTRTDSGLVATWYGFDRRVLQGQPVVTLPESAELLDVLPAGYEPAAILLQDETGLWVMRGPRRSATLSMEGRVSLALDEKGNTWTRSLVNGGPIRATPVVFLD
jgi:hypothetical protein